MQKKMGLINATQRKAKMTNAKTNANEKCKFEKGKHHNCKKMELKNASFRKAKLTIAKQMH